MALKRGRKKGADRKIMLVENDSSEGSGLAEAIQRRGHKVVWALSAEEAMHLLNDTIFIGSSFDALLANCSLSDASALRVIRDFRSEFKLAPVGLIAHQDDIATAIWANTKGIPILERPLRKMDLHHWLSQVECSAAWNSVETVSA